MFPNHFPQIPIDTSTYNLDDGDIEFLKRQTGIEDDSILRDHVLQVQAEAYAVKAYPCIRVFKFARGDISKHPAYRQAIALGMSRENAILLDLGCCMGIDVRKAISDGFPKENVIASDLVAEFWALGHKLFKTDQDTFPVPFLAGDVMDEDFLSPKMSPTLAISPPLLSTLLSLTPLHHCVSVIHTAMLFHFFDEEQQRDLANRLAMLLSPSPGSLIFGMHMGAEDTEETKNGGKRLTGTGDWVFAHSSTSWKNLWVGAGGVFSSEAATAKATTISISSKNVSPDPEEAPPTLPLILWSVTKL